MQENVVVWEPNSMPQVALLKCPCFEVFFGGARGGGKTAGMLGEWLAHSDQYGDRAVGLFVRRTFRQLSEVIAESHRLFSKLGATFVGGDKSQWTMKNGARLLFRHLDSDDDAENYQGHNYSRIYVEEVTNFPSPDPIFKLIATLRVPNVHCGIRLTGNPGGPGHSWVKKRYIDPAPEGYVPIKTSFTNPYNGKSIETERVFIPSKVIDNLALDQDQYIAQLMQSGSKQLVDAWLFGRWDVIDGAFFTEFDPARHVVSQGLLDNMPKHTTMFRAFDWGYAKPFSCGWYAVSDGTWGLPRGALVKVKEWYGCTGQPNTGLRLDAGAVAKGIKAIDMEFQKQGFKMKMGFADPAIFTRDGGPSIAEMMLENGVVWARADNKRLPGWQQIRRRLTGQDEKPMLYFAESCEDTLRTITVVQHDGLHAEDMDTDGEDHAMDELRYACMSRPYVTTAKIDVPFQYPKLPGQMTFNEILRANTRNRLREQND